MLLKEALIGNGVNHVYSVMHLDFMGISFFAQMTEKTRFLPVKTHLIQVRMSHSILESPLAMMVSILGTDIGVFQPKGHCNFTILLFICFC